METVSDRYFHRNKHHHIETLAFKDAIEWKKIVSVHPTKQKMYTI